MARLKLKISCWSCSTLRGRCQARNVASFKIFLFLSADKILFCDCNPGRRSDSDSDSNSNFNFNFADRSWGTVKTTCWARTQGTVISLNNCSRVLGEKPAGLLTAVVVVVCWWAPLWHLTVVPQWTRHKAKVKQKINKNVSTDRHRANGHREFCSWLFCMSNDRSKY